MGLGSFGFDVLVLFLLDMFLGVTADASTVWRVDYKSVEVF